MNIDFTSFAFKNKKLIYFLVAILVIGGIMSAIKMSKLEDPEIKVKMAIVVAKYPGASAHEIELQVVDPLEKTIQTIGEVLNIESTIYSDFAIIQVELNPTVETDDVEQCWDNLRRKVNDSKSKFPSDVILEVQDDFGLVYGMFYALTGDGLSELELQNYAQLIQRELVNIPSVARVEIYGAKEPCVNINIRPEKMATLGVSPSEVLLTINGQNNAYYAGYFDGGNNRIRVTVEDRSSTIEEISNMIIQGHEDDQLRLSDIASVEDGFSEPVRNSMTFNGEHALGLVIAGASGSDIVKVGHEVEQKVDELRKTRFPLGLEFNKVFYQPSQVSISLTTFLLNLLESVLIVIAVLMITMGIKSGVIIGICLFVTVIGSFLLLYQADGTMQRVSLGSFIFAMGMLVDNAIVIVDGILIDLKKGKPRMEAMTDICKKTALPLLGATLIAALAFFPVFLSPDTSGVYIRDLFIVLLVSLLLSWFLALTHVPIMCNRIFPTAIQTENGDSKELYAGRVYAFFRHTLRLGLQNRTMSVIIILALVGLSILGYGFMRQAFFPDMVYNQCYLEYKLPEGSSNKKVINDLQEIEKYLHSRNEIGNITASFGGTPARYNLVRSIATPSLSYGELIIDFKSPELLDKNLDEIQSVLEERYPDAYVKLKKYNIMFKKYPIEVMFVGPDPAVLHQLSEQAEKIMNENKSTRLVATNWDDKVPLLSVDYNQSEARRAGLTRRDVSLSLMSAAGGIPISVFYEGVFRNVIYLKCTSNDGSQLDNLNDVPLFSTIPNVHGLINKEMLIKLKNGVFDKSEIIAALLGTTPLLQVSDGLNVKWEDPVIFRYNNQRAQKVMCSPVSGGETEAARMAIAEKIEKIQLPVGYSMKWGGEKDASDRTMYYLFMNVPIGIVLMIGILIMLFGDYRRPIIILCGIPMLIIGIVSAMLITGKTFTFCSIVGALGLIGMMIKNGIVLMDEIGERMATTENKEDALIESSVSRFRPVMMASLTTILGMIPLLTDAMFGSMAATIMGGLFFSTLATLIFVPILYSIFYKVEISGEQKLL